MHSPVKKKYAAKAAHRARGVGEKISTAQLQILSQINSL